MNHIRNFFNPGNNNNDDLEEGQQEENPPLELAKSQERTEFRLGPFTTQTTQDFITQDLEIVHRLEEEADRLETECHNRQIAEEQEQIRLAQEE
ncbi:hypothetical protein Glove_54g73 [Diversispora epigaea]|uniref:Uncharacterized protein n=1 Tax=Diversispora epigaea TaxID=1348612 RepID=A0A397JNX9_9GLOM|nr:hypothetical protein Glove_54g73 [Diversispora epigaea]